MMVTLNIHARDGRRYRGHYKYGRCTNPPKGIEVSGGEWTYTHTDEMGRPHYLLTRVIHADQIFAHVDEIVHA